MSFLKQTNLLFFGTLSFIFLWPGSGDHLSPYIFSFLIYAVPILYPLSLFWIFIYTNFTRGAKRINTRTIAKVLLISLVLILFVSGLLLLYYHAGYLLIGNNRAEGIGFVHYMSTRPIGNEYKFYLAPLLFSCFLASVIKLYDIGKNEEVDNPEVNLDASA